MGDERPGGEAGEVAARPRLAKVVAASTVSPVNLGVAGAAAVAAAALGSWPILALGGAAYAALVAFDTASPSFWKKVFSGRAAAPIELPAPDTIGDPATRASVERLVASRDHLARVLADTPADIVAQLASVVASLDDLEERAARLVRRAEQLHDYLATVDPPQIQKEIDRLVERERTASDGETRAQLGQARSAREDELATIVELTQSKERLDANLTRVVAVVSGLPGKVVHLRALDGQAMDDVAGDMNAELERLVGEIGTFEETLRTLAEAPGR